MTMQHGFTTPVPVRWSDIDMYQHVNHATMVTILEEARVPFLTEPFANDFDTIGLLIAEVKVAYKGQLRLADSPLQVTIWVQPAARGRLHARLRGAVGARRSRLEARRDRASTQLAAFHIEEQTLVRLAPHHREYLQRYQR